MSSKNYHRKQVFPYLLLAINYYSVDVVLHIISSTIRY